MVFNVIRLGFARVLHFTIKSCDLLGAFVLVNVLIYSIMRIFGVGGIDSKLMDFA